MSLIDVSNLSKQYKIPIRPEGSFGAFRALFHREYRMVEALKDVAFQINRGEMVAYIGPNGAGKSTTVKVLSGILVPDGGEVKINGRTPWKERKAHVQHIGVVFGQRTQLQWDLPVGDSFELLRDIYRVDAGAYTKRKAQLVELMKLEGLLDKPVRQLSLGQRQRCDVAAALIHSPDILFLDEPTIGLDAPSKLALREFIKEMNRKEGLTVLLTTHDMEDVKALTDRVMFLHQGQMVYDGGFEALMKKVHPERHLIIESDGYPRIALPKGARWVEGSELPTVAYHREYLRATELLGALNAQQAVDNFRVEDAPLDEIIAQLYDEGVAS